MPEIGDFDVIGYVCDYLRTLLGVPVSSETPDDMPSEFVTVVRTGGPRKDIRNDEPQLTLSIYGASEADAWKLTSKVRKAMDELPSCSIEVLSVAEAGVTLANPRSAGGVSIDKVHRVYQATYFLTTTI